MISGAEEAPARAEEEVEEGVTTLQDLRPEKRQMMTTGPGKLPLRQLLLEQDLRRMLRRPLVRGLVEKVKLNLKDFEIHGLKDREIPGVKTVGGRKVAEVGKMTGAVAGEAVTGGATTGAKTTVTRPPGPVGPTTGCGGSQ